MEIENKNPETVDELIAELERLRDEVGEDFEVDGGHKPIYLSWRNDHLEVR